jgi:asparagine synthase (glutamine-hydrolysing)
MCGIAAAIDWDGANEAVARMIEGIRHRGDITDPLISPGPNTAICTRRLRIVDAENGMQPKLSCDGRVLVAMNGEIYNHAELRRELEALGAAFHSECDTEVLANALAAWGAAALGRLVGMFAFVAFDLMNGDFVAGRDPLGVKPLYLVNRGQGFLFCSEIKPLLDVCETGEVLLVPPGFVLTKTVCAPYPSVFSAPPPPHADDPKRLDAILAAAVERRVPPDLPFAVLFSGGIDSTLVAHYARRVRPEAPGYFLGGPTAPDHPFAAAYAEASGMDLRIVQSPDSAAEAAALAREVIAVSEAFEPNVIRGSLCQYLLSRKIHEDGFRVVLTGEGADELFAGYAPLELAFAHDAAIGADARAQYLSDMNRGNLQRLDRSTMRFEIEAREPFLDPEVIGWALGASAGELVKTVRGEPRGKAPLRALFDLHPRELPKLIRDRKKTPFSEGAGFDVSRSLSPWRELAEQEISDKAFEEGRRRFAGFALNDKEELYNLQILAETFDVERVPHLKGRITLKIPSFPGLEKLSEDVLKAS